MDALRVLKDQHNEVEHLFKEVQRLDTTDAQSRAQLFGEIDRKLTLHSHIEETIFYPAVKERAQTRSDIDGVEEVLEAFEEHGLVKDLLQKLEDTTPADERYEARLQVLQETVLHHVHEEEHHLFPAVKRLMSKEELDQLGNELLTATQRGEESIATQGGVTTIRGTAGEVPIRSAR